MLGARRAERRADVITHVVANAQTKTPGTTTANRVTECKPGFYGDAAENPTACTACTADTDFAPISGATSCMAVRAIVAAGEK